MKKNLVLMRHHLPALADYFGQMAQKGFRLKDYQLDTAEFEQAEPEDLRYGLVKTTQMPMEKQELPMYDLLDKVCENRGYQVCVFCGPQETLDELPRPKAQGGEARRIFRVLYRHLLDFLIFLFLLCVVNFIQFGYGSLPLITDLLLGDANWYWFWGTAAFLLVKICSDPCLYLSPSKQSGGRWHVDAAVIDIYPKIERIRSVVLRCGFAIVLISAAALIVRTGMIVKACSTDKAGAPSVSLQEIQNVEPGLFTQNDENQYNRWISYGKTDYMTMQKSYTAYAAPQKWEAGIGITVMSTPRKSYQ